MYELDLDFEYDKQKYGSSLENSVVSRSYSGGVSIYLFEQTAIDLNYSNTSETTTYNDRYTIATGYDVTSSHNYVDTVVYGIGIKQMLLPKQSLILPMVELGYAKEFITYLNDVVLENTTNSTSTTTQYGNSKYRIDSVSASFILQFKLTQSFSLKGTVKTLFPAFEFNKAKDNLKYLAGISWIF
jgi:hypothetical protein